MRLTIRPSAWESFRRAVGRAILTSLCGSLPAACMGYTELSTVEGIGGVLLKSYPESQLIEYVTRARVS